MAFSPAELSISSLSREDALLPYRTDRIDRDKFRRKDMVDNGEMVGLGETCRSTFNVGAGWHQEDRCVAFVFSNGHYGSNLSTTMWPNLPATMWPNLTTIMSPNPTTTMWLNLTTTMWPNLMTTMWPSCEEKCPSLRVTGNYRKLLECLSNRTLKGFLQNNLGCTNMLGDVTMQ
ncbi:hypothetical protein COLO4_06495 [Corchorus olitorius]|uniref:Uncharacterized protein n=1 Tax=Corchorus olitorius TaxID=93759 RepID=A0A1R3KMU8_9ROSI|nr:hypothetical protein COLO4_06495 [Corchorus olitorius]